MSLLMFILNGRFALERVRTSALASSKDDPTALRVDDWTLYQQDMAATRALHPTEPATHNTAAPPCRAAPHAAPNQLGDTV